MYLWDVSTGRILRRYQGHFQRINAVAFNSESTVLASGASWSARYKHIRDFINRIDCCQTRAGVEQARTMLACVSGTCGRSPSSPSRSWITPRTA